MLLDDKDAGVRAEALFAAGQLAWKAEFSDGREKEILTALTPRLKDEEAAVRAAAVEAVGKLGMAEAPGLMAPSLKDPAAPVRAEAAIGLFRWRLAMVLRGAKRDDLPALPVDVVASLCALGVDGDALVRRNVAYYFYRVKDVRGLEAMLKLAGDEHLETRIYATGALGRQGDAKAVDALVKATGDAEYLVRLAALQSLQMLKEGSKAPAKLASDPSYHVRAAYVASADDKTLEKMAKDGSVAVRCEVLKKRHDEPSIRTAMKDGNWLLREAAAEACGSLEKGVEAAVAPALEDPDERVVAKAVEVIAAVQTKSAWETLGKALGSESLLVRATAVESLAKRKEEGVFAVGWSAYESCGDRKWVEVREGIVDLFASKPGPEAERRLRMLARDPAPSVAAKARKALKEQGAGDLPPARAIDPVVNPHAGLVFETNPIVILETNRGVMEIECFAGEAPVHVANFVGLVKAKVYDGLQWHRVVPSFVIQGGDPNGTGMGDSGWSLRAEINRTRYERGTLGMPRSDGFDTGGCQLFFTHLPTPHLDGQYTVFGRIVKGLEVMDAIERGDVIVSATVR